MSRSLLLQIARESISEVLEAQNRIDKEALFEQYPVLKEAVPSFISIYLNNELRGSMGTTAPNRSLLEDIIHHAKAAAFEDKRFSPLKTSEYLQSSIELSLLSTPEEIFYEDIDDLRQKVKEGKDGLILVMGKKRAALLPQVWSQMNDFESFLSHLLQEAGLSLEEMKMHPQILKFQVEKERDEPILN